MLQKYYINDCKENLLKELKVTKALLAVEIERKDKENNKKKDKEYINVLKGRVDKLIEITKAR